MVPSSYLVGSPVNVDPIDSEEVMLAELRKAAKNKNQFLDLFCRVMNPNPLTGNGIIETVGYKGYIEYLKLLVSTFRKFMARDRQYNQLLNSFKKKNYPFVFTRAVDGEQIAILKFLIEEDLLIIDEYLRNCILPRAVEKDNVEILQLLLHIKMDVVKPFNSVRQYDAGMIEYVCNSLKKATPNAYAAFLKGASLQVVSKIPDEGPLIARAIAPFGEEEFRNFINGKELVNKTALYVAACMGKINAFKFLLPIYGKQCVDGWEKIHAAVESSGSLAMLALFREHCLKNSITLKEDGSNLFAAIKSDNVEMFKEVILHGGDINAAFVNNCTAFENAIFLEKLSILQYLIKEHPELINKRGRRNDLPLEFAIGANKPKSLKVLLDHGAQINRFTIGGIFINAIVLDYVKVIEQLVFLPNFYVQLIINGLGCPCSDQMFSLLFKALEKNLNEERVKDLIRQILLGIATGKTTIDKFGILLKYKETLVKILQDEPEHFFNAVYFGHAALVNEILKLGISPKTCIDVGTPIFHIACQEGHVGLIDSFLLEAPNGADEKTKNECLRQKKDILEMPSNQGWTPLMVAIHHRQYDVVVKLLSHQVNLNVVAQDGQSAFSLALQNNQEKMIQLLFKSKIIFALQKTILNTYTNKEDGKKFKEFLKEFSQTFFKLEPTLNTEWGFKLQLTKRHSADNGNDEEYAYTFADLKEIILTMFRAQYEKAEFDCSTLKQHLREYSKKQANAGEKESALSQATSANDVSVQNFNGLLRAISLKRFEIQELLNDSDEFLSNPIASRTRLGDVAPKAAANETMRQKMEDLYLSVKFKNTEEILESDIVALSEILENFEQLYIQVEEIRDNEEKAKEHYRRQCADEAHIDDTLHLTRIAQEKALEMAREKESAKSDQLKQSIQRKEQFRQDEKKRKEESRLQREKEEALAGHAKQTPLISFKDLEHELVYLENFIQENPELKENTDTKTQATMQAEAFGWLDLSCRLMEAFKMFPREDFKKLPIQLKVISPRQAAKFRNVAAHASTLPEFSLREARGMATLLLSIFRGIQSGNEKQVQQDWDKLYGTGHREGQTLYARILKQPIADDLGPLSGEDYQKLMHESAERATIFAENKDANGFLRKHAEAYWLGREAGFIGRLKAFYPEIFKQDAKANQDKIDLGNKLRHRELNYYEYVIEGGVGNMKAASSMKTSSSMMSARMFESENTNASQLPNKIVVGNHYSESSSTVLTRDFDSKIDRKKKTHQANTNVAAISSQIRQSASISDRGASQVRQSTLSTDRGDTKRRTN